MANPLHFLPQTFTALSATSEASGYPASNLTLALHPRRPHRTTGVVAQTVILDCGAAVVLKAAFLNNANFPTCAIAVSSSSTFASDVTTLGTFTLSLDDRVNRRKLWADCSSNALSKRYVRLSYSGTPDAGATYYELGVVALGVTVVTWLDSPAWPVAFVRGQASTRLPFLSGGEDVGEDGVPFLESLTFASRVWRQTSGVRAQLFAILDYGLAAPWVIYENRGDATKAYCVRRVGDMPVEEQLVTFSAALTVREAI